MRQRRVNGGSGGRAPSLGQDDPRYRRDATPKVQPPTVRREDFAGMVPPESDDPAVLRTFIAQLLSKLQGGS